MARRGFDPGYSFRSQDFREHESESGQSCARGDFCLGRVITWDGDTRIVTPARSPRPYCDRCQRQIGTWAGDLPGFYVRLAFLIGEPVQTEWPAALSGDEGGGPQVIIREDVEGHMRLLAATVAGWAARVRAVPGLELSPPKYPHGSLGGVRDNAVILATHTGPLIALQRAWMTRLVPMPPMPRDEDMMASGADWLPDGTLAMPRAPADPIPADLVELYADHELMRVTIDSIQPLGTADGEDAGREIQYLHYRCRSLLLETNPPPELLLVPCRQCTLRSLRRAWPESDRDLYSRCDNCQDEMDSPEYEQNSRRWLAYHKAHAERPVLADVPAA